MRQPPGFALPVCLIISLGACRPAAEAAAADLQHVERARELQLARRIAMADADPKRVAPVAKWIMPPELREISGLSLMPDGRVLAHGDESGRVYVIDPRHGVLLKQFALGTALRGDFESITMAGSDIYLLASNGILYQFKEGADGSGVPYSAQDLEIGNQCEFESMAYQADSDWLVMPCKKVTDKKLHDQLVTYRWRLKGPDADRVSRVTIPFSRVVGNNRWKSLHPSDMTIDPTTGDYVIIASREKALIEITRSGELVRSEPLPSGHNQPEGIAITRDSILMLSDESNHAPAAITLYRWRRAHSTSTRP